MNIKDCKVTMLIDSREQKLLHITDIWDAKNVDYVVLKEKQSMNIGDYSIGITTAEGEKISLADKIAIERKANLNELCNNLTEAKDKSGNSRIVREFIRAKENNIKLILLIEDIKGYEKALKGEFRNDNKKSYMNVNSFLGMLFAYKSRYNFEIVWIDKKYTASYIYKLLYYEAREHLNNLKDRKNP